MSAYVVSQSHISAIVMFACVGKPDDATRQILTSQGQQLLDENIRSVQHRYPRETLQAERFELDETVRKPSAVEVLKLMSCLEYQSEQNPDYYITSAFLTLHGLRLSAMSKLAGYDQAKWDLD